MTGTTPREQLAAQIKADNPVWIVNSYPMAPANVKKGIPVVSVWRSEVAPEKRQHLSHELTIHVYGSKTFGDEAEAELDNYYDAIMLSIERYKGCVFARATRQHFAESSFTGWAITCSVYSNNIYREAVLQERSAS